MMRYVITRDLRRVGFHRLTGSGGGAVTTTTRPIQVATGDRPVTWNTTEPTTMATATAAAAARLDGDSRPLYRRVCDCALMRSDGECWCRRAAHNSTKERDREREDETWLL